MYSTPLIYGKLTRINTLFVIKSDTKKVPFFELLSIWAYVVIVSLNSLVVVMALHRAQVRETKKSVSRS